EVAPVPPPSQRVAPPQHVQCRSVVTERVADAGGWALVPMIMSAQRVPEVSRLAMHSGVESYLHLSSLIDDGCARAVVLATDSPDVAFFTQPTGATMRLIWAIGRAVEQEVVESFVAAQPAMVWGDWRCACGTLGWRGYGATDPPVCERCGCRARYTGAVFYDE